MELVRGKNTFILDKHYRPQCLPNRYLATMVKPDGNTLRTYGYALCHWLQYCEDRHIEWQTITKDVIIQYRKSLKGGNRTQNSRIARLKAFYDWCQPYGIFNPFEQLIRQPRLIYSPVSRQEVRLVPVKTVGKFIDVLSERDRLIAKVMLFCGLRRSEVLSLTQSFLWETDKDGVPFSVRGKGGKVRTLRMPSVLQQQLKDWVKKQPASAWIFHRNGQPLCADTIGAAFRKACKATGIPIHPHLLRHTFATRRLAQLEKQLGGFRGMNSALLVVQYELGHSHLMTTARYLHMLNPDEVPDCYGDFVEALTREMLGGAA